MPSLSSGPFRGLFSGRSRRSVLVVLAGALMVALLVVAVVMWRGSQVTTFERAVAQAPEDTARMTYVDWSGLRAELGVTLSARSSTEELGDLLDRGFDRDLTGPSGLLESATSLHERFRLSPAVLEWESLAQSPAGAAITLALPASYDFDALGDRLESIGYARPRDASGVWVGGPEMLSRNAVGVSPLFQHLVLLEEEGLVLASDEAPYAGIARDAALGEDALEPEGVVGEADDPLSAIYLVGDFGCGALAMSQADPDSEQIAASLVREAGKINPYTGLVVSAQPGGDLRMSFGFANSDQARINATTRARLAEGPAPGQGGDFTDRFSLESATADGSLVTLDLRPADEDSYVFSDLSSGPVLLATC
ncbi:hypothetical protein [Nocardioides sp.]|uniref:hypothetical protein n=1 Tax=Nocardioides sp. TaxID=35761 RepID=UPI0027376EF2|nr:hypothetical protein [Nocardioides sp.]MDP3893215.1 hypothetical protein [Nocardioides sp.]